MSDVPFISPVAIGEMLDAAFMPQGYYVELACMALIVYEYLLTVESERRAVWARPWSIPNVLFLLNRYLLVVFGLAIFLWGFITWETDSICRFPAILQVTVPVTMMTVNTVFVAMRIHVINNRRWFWTVLLILLGFVDIPPNIVLLVQGEYVAIRPTGLPWWGCAEASYEPDRLDKPIWKRVMISISVAGFVSSVLLVAITWYRTFRQVLDARKVMRRESLGYYLLRDGTTYFLTSTILNVVIIFIELKRSITLSLVAITLQSILTSRFFINLRMAPIDPSQTLPSMSANTESGVMRMSEIRFAPSSFDALGAPLDVSGANDLEHENEYLEIEEDANEGTSHGPGVVGEYHAVPDDDTDGA